MRIATISTGPEGYLVLFVWVFAEQIGLPIPAAPALLAAGALAVGGRLSVFPAIAAALSASLLADYLWYLAGALKSGDVDRFLRRHPDLRVLRTAERLFERYGSQSLTFAKFVPGFSLVAPPLAGMCGLSASEFLVFDTIGASIWIGAFIGAGYFVGGAIQIGTLLGRISPLIWPLAALAAGLAAVILWRKRGRHRNAFALRYITYLLQPCPARAGSRLTPDTTRAFGGVQ